MRSKTSFFNRGLSLSIVRRCWPIWTSYFALLLIMAPGNLMSIVERMNRYSYNAVAEDKLHFVWQLNRSMLQSGVDMAILSFFACVLVAMAMFGYMYNNRSCSMFNSLPLKRDTVFSTAYLTGIVPLLLADILVALICLGFTADGLDAKNVWLFLAAALMGNVAFYGMAAFCAMLTGHILILPAVYVVLNLAAEIAEGAIYCARSVLVYGFSGRDILEGLSPVVAVFDRLHVSSELVRSPEGGMMETGVYFIDGIHYLIIYCIVGLVLSALALLLYRRRRMESCGDVVAIPILKPIFRYCMCFGVALSFAAVVYDAVLGNVLQGLSEAAVYLMMMLTGAFIGYFAAEVLMQKTLRVFRGKWKGFIISCLILAAFVAVNEFDLTGYEKRLPERSEIESVRLTYHEGSNFEQPENIDAMLDFHRQLIGDKALNESSYPQNLWSISLTYTMADGSTFSRNYPVSCDVPQQLDKSSSVNTLRYLVNLQEAIDQRASTEVPVTEKVILDPIFEGSFINAKGEREHFSHALTDAQAVEFYESCIVPDAAEGKLCRIFPYSDEEYYNTVTPVSFHFGLLVESEDLDDWHNSYKSFTIYLDAERCCKWIEENTDIELISVGEYDPEAMESTLNELNSGEIVTTRALG